MLLNSKPGIRAALAHSNYIADMCRKVQTVVNQHNDANIVVIPTHCLGVELVKSVIDSYIVSGFDGEPRNQKRL